MRTLRILYYYLKAKSVSLLASTAWIKSAFKFWQQRRLTRFLNRISKTSPYYGAYWGKPFGEWPIIDKALMMKHFDQINTHGIGLAEAFEVALKSEQTRDFSPTIRGVAVGLSSGTSGSRGIFLADAADQARWAGTILGKVLPRSILGRHRIALFLRASSNLYETLGSRKIQFSFFDLMKPIDLLLAQFIQFSPTLVVGPPSMLRMLADAIRAGEVSQEVVKNVEKWVSVAEVLDPVDQVYIEKWVGQPVAQIYQCTEGLLATTCASGSLHLNEDLVFVEKEWLDRAAGKFVPVITDFVRTTQPIIRYRLNDILTESLSPCACGSIMTRLSQIEGRCDDLFLLPEIHGGPLREVFPDFMRRAVISASSEIEQYRVVQTRPSRVEVELTLKSSLLEEQVRSAVASQIVRMAEDLKCEAPEVVFVTPRKLQPGVKLRRIERTFER